MQGSFTNQGATLKSSSVGGTTTIAVTPTLAQGGTLGISSGSVAISSSVVNAGVVSLQTPPTAAPAALDVAGNSASRRPGPASPGGRLARERTVGQLKVTGSATLGGRVHRE